MAHVPVQGNQILVDVPSNEGREPAASPQAALSAWLVGKADPWEAHRNNGYHRLWGEYWRMWRGRWVDQDKNRKSERSRLIGPALAQAIEMTVAEIEEAVFSRENWLDVHDDIDDQEKDDAVRMRDALLEDFDEAGVPDTVAEAVLVGAIFGTSIIKLSPEIVPETSLVRSERTGRLEKVEKERVLIVPQSLRPDEFIPDPAGKTIDEMLGCFHKVTVPLHTVLEKIEIGTYRKDALRTLVRGRGSEEHGQEVDFGDPGTGSEPTNTETVELLEYHGKIPLSMLHGMTSGVSTPLDEVISHDLRTSSEVGDGPLIEAIVTVANRSTILRAIPNPLVMVDRSIIAAQFEKVPGRFWGRGVAEKGYHPQKALDMELRARADALGFVSSPMLGIDSGRIPPGFKMEVRPGKVWLTNGPPSEVIQPIKIGDINGHTFNQTQEMERMVQMGTGAMDTASALKGGNTSTGGNGLQQSSLMLGAFVKRAKRALNSLDRNLLSPLVRKSLWRYMQYAPTRYPNDFKFQIRTTMGLVAREVEQLNLTQLMAMLPQEFPQVSVAVAQGIVDLSNVENKAQIMAAMEQALAPPSEEEQQKQQALQEMEFARVKAETQGLLLENQKTMAETRKLLAEATVAARKADNEDDRIAIEQLRTQLQAMELETFREQNEIAGRRLELQEKALELKARQQSSK